MGHKTKKKSSLESNTTCVLGWDQLGSSSLSNQPTALGRGQLCHCPNLTQHTVPSTCLLLRPAPHPRHPTPHRQTPKMPLSLDFVLPAPSKSPLIAVQGTGSETQWSLSAGSKWLHCAQLSPLTALKSLNNGHSLLEILEVRWNSSYRVYLVISMGICWQNGRGH